jgi:two-component system, OmpR family, phosphate regulon sensor histidine kinase PhoR
MKRATLTGVIAVILALNLFAASMLAATFFATTAAFAMVNYRPEPLTSQLINTLLGNLLTFISLALLGRLIGPRQGEIGWLGPIIAAMEQIARGDFAVRLDDTNRNNTIIDTLARSVNTMASGLEQFEAMRQEFISNVSHEIQSPLTSIRGFARALQSERLPPDERLHYLTIIETECMRLSKLSDNLLALTALESSGLRIEAQAYRLDQQIREVVVAAEPQWVAQGLDVEVALETATIVADAGRLCQVWTNLLHNSIKFTPAGGQICIGMRQQGAEVSVTVADTGVGIVDEDLPHVFERFFKADRSRERARGGSGLGLAIARKIVELHGGTIGVESAPGAGSTFTVRLPLRPAEAPHRRRRRQPEP